MVISGVRELLPHGLAHDFMNIVSGAKWSFDKLVFFLKSQETSWKVYGISEKNCSGQAWPSAMRVTLFSV